jgi:hypothetical protein
VPVNRPARGLENDTELIDVVRRLVGPVHPVGETNTDYERLENLKQLTELVDFLVYDINRVRSNKNRPEFSMELLGDFADQFLTKFGIEE